MLSFESWVGKVKTGIITGEFVVISSNNKLKKKKKLTTTTTKTTIMLISYYYYYYHHFIYKDNHLIDQGDFWPKIH